MLCNVTSADGRMKVLVSHLTLRLECLLSMPEGSEIKDKYVESSRFFSTYFTFRSPQIEAAGPVFLRSRLVVDRAMATKERDYP